MTRFTCQREKRKSAPARSSPYPQTTKMATMQRSPAVRSGAAGGTWPRTSTCEPVMRRNAHVAARSTSTRSRPEKNRALTGIVLLRCWRSTAPTGYSGERHRPLAGTSLGLSTTRHTTPRTSSECRSGARTAAITATPTASGTSARPRSPFPANTNTSVSRPRPATAESTIGSVRGALRALLCAGALIAGPARRQPEHGSPRAEARGGSHPTRPAARCRMGFRSSLFPAAVKTSMKKYHGHSAPSSTHELQTAIHTHRDQRFTNGGRQVARGQRAEALPRVAPVGLELRQVVEHVHARGDEPEREEGEEIAHPEATVAEPVSGQEGDEEQRVLRPLVEAELADEEADPSQRRATDRHGVFSCRVHRRLMPDKDSTGVNEVWNEYEYRAQPDPRVVVVALLFRRDDAILTERFRRRGPRSSDGSR